MPPRKRKGVAASKLQPIAESPQKDEPQDAARGPENDALADMDQQGTP